MFDQVTEFMENNSDSTLSTCPCCAGVGNDAEKTAIQTSGKFEFRPSGSTPTGEAGKFFWSSMEVAQQFQPYWYRAGENSHIVSTTLAPNATPTLFPHTDGIGTAIWAPLEDLTAPIVFH
jgi:hypothetical protein